MIGSVFILAISLMLFVYWFRYACLLLLQTKPVVDFSEEVVAAHDLSLPEVLVGLREQIQGAQLATLRESLDRDFTLLTGLLTRTATDQPRDCTIEDRLLMIDYAVMRVWSAAARRLFPSRAKQALTEMAQIVAYFAGVVGESTYGSLLLSPVSISRN